jgi:hypothetical protein
MKGVIWMRNFTVVRKNRGERQFTVVRRNGR